MWCLGICREYFDITPDFPACQLLRRGQDANKKRNLYFVNDIIKRIIENNNDCIKVMNLRNSFMRKLKQCSPGDKCRNEAVQQDWRQREQ